MDNSYEPGYISHEISKESARDIIINCKFIMQLKTMPLITKKILNYYKVYNSLKEYLKDSASTIIDDEIKINGSLGSPMLFSVYSYKKLNNKLISKIIDDMNIVNLIKYINPIQQKYKEYYYKPDGPGYNILKKKFYNSNIVKKT